MTLRLITNAINIDKLHKNPYKPSSYKKKMKPDLYLWTFVAAGILLSPFILIYNVSKKLYDMTPARAKKIRKIQQETKEQEKEWETKIKEFEKELGLENRSPQTFHYDPYYYKNHNGNRYGYLKELIRKKNEDYKDPETAILIKETKIGCQIFLNDCIVKVYVMLRKDRFYSPKDAQQADIAINRFTSRTISEFYNTVTTLSECGNYENYYISQIPGTFRYTGNGIISDIDKINKYIDILKQEYLKP